MKQKFYKIIHRVSSFMFYIKQNIQSRRQHRYPSGTVGTIQHKNLKIGKNVSFGGSVALLGNGTIDIGDHSMIGYGTIIHTSTHDYTEHPMWQTLISRPVKIGSHVWIGTGAIVLPGVAIGDYSVIGAGAIVVANVPNGVIVAGNPARVIKYRKIPKHTDLPLANIKVKKIVADLLQKEVK
ncbi:MAG: acyltransferase [bacterium]|nr:acyltransferase [bacterium]